MFFVDLLDIMFHFNDISFQGNSILKCENEALTVVILFTQQLKMMTKKIALAIFFVIKFCTKIEINFDQQPSASQSTFMLLLVNLAPYRLC